MASEVVMRRLNRRTGQMECRVCGYDHWAFLEGEALAADDFGKVNKEARSVSREARVAQRKAAHGHS